MMNKIGTFLGKRKSNVRREELRQTRTGSYIRFLIVLPQLESTLPSPRLSNQI